MSRVKHHLCPHFIGNRAHRGDGMFEQVEAAPDGDQLRVLFSGQIAQTIKVDRIAIGRDRGLQAAQPKQTGASWSVMCHMPADAGGRRDDGIPRFAGRHEAIEIGQRPGSDADLGIFCVENFCCEIGCDHFDLLDRLQPHFVFVTGMAKRRPGAETGRQQGFGLWVHHVCSRIEVEALLFVNNAIFLTECMDALQESGRIRIFCCGTDCLDPVCRGCSQPVAGGLGHLILLGCGQSASLCGDVANQICYFLG